MGAFVTVTNSYQIQPTDQFINVIPGTGIGLTLPNISSVPVGKIFTIKDIGGTAATYNIPVGGNGTTVDGSAVASVVVNYGVMTVVSNGSVWASNNDIAAVAGPASATDNTLVRFDGTSGKATQGSSIVVTDLDAMSGEKWAFTDNTAVTVGYTLVAADTGKIVRMNLSVSRALTLPNDLTVGFGCDVVQTGASAGKVVFTAGSGATLTGNSAVTTSAGIWARCSLFVTANSTGTAAVYVLSGNLG